MRRSLMTLLATLLLATLAVAQNPPKRRGPAAATPGPDRQLMQSIWEAWSTLNPEAASKFYDKGATHVFFDITPLKYTGWADYQRGVRDVLAQFQSFKATVNPDAQIHRHGDLAWGAATWHGDIVNKDGSKSSMDGRWTVLWRRKGNDWLIVHEHVSVPLSQEAPKKQ